MLDQTSRAHAFQRVAAALSSNRYKRYRSIQVSTLANFTLTSVRQSCKPKQKPIQARLLRFVKRPGHNGSYSIECSFPARGRVAQLGERLVRNEEVAGSIPVSSTNLFGNLACFRKL
jgi:hypothetical protein